jgi:hypothetical protein
MRKADHRDVLDPITITLGSFRLNFLTFLLVPNPALPSADSTRVVATIERLELNTDRDYVNERIAAIRQYCTGKVTLTQLGIRYPFIVAEMQNQKFDTNFLPRMRDFFNRGMSAS